MKKLLSFRILVPAVLSAIMFALPLSAVFADQTFYFTDDFNTVYHVDQTLTSNVMNASGEEFLVIGALNGSITSSQVNAVNGSISSAVIDSQFTAPVGTYVLFYISNDDGANWYQVQRGVNFPFSHAGSQLRWRAYMSRSYLDYNPFLESVTISYTITGNANTSDQYVWQGGSGSGLNPVALNMGGLADPNTLICRALAIVGLSCNAYSASSNQSHSSPLSFNIFGGSSSTPKNPSTDLTADIATAGAKDLNGNAINLVKVPGSNDIYELANGHKHLFPNATIFASYGYTSDMIQGITQEQLNKYPRAYLMNIKGDTKSVYYLTEGGMVRLLPKDQKVLDSYGDRQEDIVTVNRQEFNFYPVNQYVFLETPLNRDVFQLTNGGKRYLTPMAVARMHISSDQIAPINQVEFDAYKTLAPVVN